MVTVRAPGRVNLIGEHTDYNDGFMLPAAVGLYTTVRGRRAGDNGVVFRQARSDAEREADNAYSRGVLIELERAGVELPPSELTVDSTLPIGGGLSSSASFEVAVALTMLALADATLDRMDVARLCQRAENEHVGIRSGIMDQFAVLFGRSRHALLLDSRTLAWRPIAIPENACIVVCNTMVKHELASGEYNRRRAQCEAAVTALQRWYPDADALRDVTVDQLFDHRDAIEPVAYRRARHVVTEDVRVLQFADAMEAGDLARAGELMNASHESLRDDYEVSSAELDLLVAMARDFGVFGARMTGGGFGGCTVNLVDRAHAPALIGYVRERYRAQTGITPEIYDGTPVDGAA
ncbi:MAG: galactokinase [Candidatus Eremiobacteraeota bacterium]|nr:galactokinase [Candidatus Eremiobacteraeota bacterium]